MEGQNKVANPNEALPPSQVQRKIKLSSEVPINITSSSSENFPPKPSSSSSGTFVFGDTQAINGKCSSDFKYRI